ERLCARCVGGVDGEMAHVRQCEESRFRRSFNLHDIAHCAAATGIRDVLNLQNKVVGVTEKNFGWIVSGATIHTNLHRAAGQSRISCRSARDAMLLECGHNSIGVEALDFQSKTRNDTRRVTAGRDQQKKLRTVSNTQKNILSLTRLNGHPE